MEVLISCFVLSMGLIGVAALLPLGRFAINETGKADRAGACGRAAMREIKIRHLLDGLNSSNPQYQWLTYGGGVYGAFTNPNGGAFFIDPLGIANWAVNSGTVASAFQATPPPTNSLQVYIPFVTPAYLVPASGGTLGFPASLVPAGGTAALPAAAAAGQVFAWHDDLTFTNPEGLTLSGTAALGQSSRPLDTIPRLSGGGAGANAGNYSWFLTVTPSPSEFAPSLLSYDPKHYSVSVVVCYGRDFSTNGKSPNGMKEAYVYSGPTVPISGGAAGVPTGFAQRTDKRHLAPHGQQGHANPEHAGKRVDRPDRLLRRRHRQQSGVPQLVSHRRRGRQYRER